MSNTSILIRVQARGGKFLGPDINYAYVWVNNADTGECLSQGQAGHHSASNPSASNDSGVLSASLDGLAGPSTGIVLSYGEDTTQAPQVWYLGVNPHLTASFLASFDLTAPTRVEICAAGLDANGNPNQYTAFTTMWLEPGMQLTADPGYIITIPGLAVTIESCAKTDFGIAVSAKVTMMCGCPINDATTVQAPGPIPWPSNEFGVTAEIWAGANRIISAPLALSSTSTFSGVIPLTGGLATIPQPRLTVTATQALIANVGSDSLPI
jgi:hypothetical protein